MLIPTAWLCPKNGSRPSGCRCRSIIKEHARLDLTEPAAWATLALAAGYLTVLIGILPKRPRITWLLPLVWFVLAVQRSAKCVAVCRRCRHRDGRCPSRFARGPLAARPRDVLLAPPACRLASGRSVADVRLVGRGRQLAGIACRLSGEDWARFDSARWPVELLPKLAESTGRVRTTSRIFNDLCFGGFLIYMPRG